MSVDRPCECGAVIPAYVLGCLTCGKKYKVRDEFLVGQDILPEPPIGMWAQQHKESKKSKSFFTKRSLKRSQRGSRGRKSAKEFLIIILAFAFGFYLVSNLLGNSNAMSEIMFKIKTASVQVLPKSEAYKLGFDQGKSFRDMENLGQYMAQHMADYGDASLSNTLSTDSEENSRKLAKEYATGVWESMGFINFLENTEANKRDFVAGFMAGKFG